MSDEQNSGDILSLEDTEPVDLVEAGGAPPAGQGHDSDLAAEDTAGVEVTDIEGDAE